MHCIHCGQSISENDVFCSYCGTRIQPEAYYCANCGKEILHENAVCLHCGYHNEANHRTYKVKSKIVAGVLGIVFGGWGIHNFYLGYSSKGIIQLMCTFLGIWTFGISSTISVLWGLVEGIMILTGHIDKDGNDLYIK